MSNAMTVLRNLYEACGEPREFKDNGLPVFRFYCDGTNYSLTRIQVNALLIEGVIVFVDKPKRYAHKVLNRKPYIRTKVKKRQCRKCGKSLTTNFYFHCARCNNALEALSNEHDNFLYFT